MGVVYLGRDDSLNRDVALKVLPEILSDSRAQAGLHRFYVEAQAIAALRHPNIIVIYELGHEGTTPFIAMEYLPGASLAEAIRDRRPYSDADKVRVIGDVCLALQHAHDRGIIHRDVKPGNIHIDDGGSVKLLDFGVAKFAEVSQTQSLYAVGTPSYLAPEVIAGHGADTRSDLFALGVTLSEWLTFEKPFAGDDVAQVMWKVVHEEATPVRQICPSVSPHLEHVIGKALAKDPAKRYQRADEMRADLARVTDVGEVTIVRPVRGEVTIVRPARIEPGAPALQPADVSRRRLIQALGLGVALLCAAAVWLASKQPPSTVVTIAPAAARPQESKVPPSLLPVERGGLQAERHAPAAVTNALVKPAPAAVEAPVAPPPAAPEEDTAPEVLAPIGTRILASLVDELNTSRSRAGDAFRAVLDEPIAAGSREVAAVGALVNGRVYAVGGGGRPFVEIALTSMIVNGRTVPIRTSVYRVVAPASSGPSLTTLIVGAVAGAGLGAAVGGKAGALTGAAAGAAIGTQTSVPGSAYISGAHMAFKLAEALPATVLR
jgi:hypothetical protein